MPRSAFVEIVEANGTTRQDPVETSCASALGGRCAPMARCHRTVSLDRRSARLCRWQSLRGAQVALAAPMNSLLTITSILGLAALAACRDAGAATATTSCTQYPIPLRPADGAQAAAQAELARMAPGATL